jgi:hypothetical protein
VNLRKEAAKALGTMLVAAVPGLNNKFTVATAEPEVDAAYAGLVVVLGKYRFEPNQDEEAFSVSDTRELFQVGVGRGDTELRVYAKTPFERAKLEADVEQALLQRTGSPGVTIVSIPNVEIGGLQTTYTASAAYVLEDLEWNEELAFDRRRYSFMTLSTEIEVLVLRSVTRMTDLRIGLTEDMEGDLPLPADEIEVVAVNSDGSVSPSTQP